MLGSKKHVIPDVVAFVNGLPLAIIECKSPTIGDAWKAEAVKQLRRYQEADSRWKNQGAALATDDAKASEMEHAIRHEISVRAEENPAFYQSLRERLEEIIAARRQETARRGQAAPGW